MSSDEEQKIVISEENQKMGIDSNIVPSSSVDQEDTEVDTSGDIKKTAEEIQEINEKFVSAAEDGNLSEVQQLLTNEKTLDIGYKDERFQKSAISYAAYMGHVDVVRLKAGGEITEQRPDGMSGEMEEEKH